MNILFLAVVLVVVCCLSPLVVGILALLPPAFGFYPALGAHDFTLEIWQQLFNWPGLGHSVWLSIFVCLMSTLLALVISLTTLSLLWNRPCWRWVSLYIAPAMALPHVAFAVGLGFLLAPSGWLIRLVTPVFGWVDPPQIMTVNDPWGGALIAMLVVKEVPFLLLMAVGVLHQIKPEQQLVVARSLGYDRVQAWWKVLVPQLYRQLKLPLFAVMVYGLTVVDAALIIGPQLPPPLAVNVYHWFNHPDLTMRMLACCGAVLLLLLTLVTMLFWQGAEMLLKPVAHNNWFNGRKQVHHPILWLAFSVLPLLAAMSVLSLIGLFIWSFAKRWRFPDMLPSQWSLSNWDYYSSLLLPPLGQAMLLGLISSLLAIIAVVVVLEYQHQKGCDWPLVIPCAALFIPQMTLFAGLPVLLGPSVNEWPLLTVIFGHLLMVFPYIYLGLNGPYKAFDPRLQTLGLTMGASPLKVWWSVKWPLLKPAVVSAWAVGFGVSIVQYLPTLLLGGGRVITITTEAVSVGGGYDRRLAAIYGLSQALLPLLGFMLARLLNRRKQWQV